MSKLSLDLPNVNPNDSTPINIPQAPGFRFSGDQTSLGYVLSQFIQLAFWIATFLVFIYFAWGVYEYIIAEGQKENLQKARKKILWSVTGFVILIMAIFVSMYARTIFPQVDEFYKSGGRTIQQSAPAGTYSATCGSDSYWDLKEQKCKPF